MHACTVSIHSVTKLVEPRSIEVNDNVDVMVLRLAFVHAAVSTAAAVAAAPTLMIAFDEGVPAADLQKLYFDPSAHCRSGAACWTGGDSASSLALSDQRTLWVFGDSLIGQFKTSPAHQRVEAGSSIAAQALAIVTSAEPRWAAPSFHWNSTATDRTHPAVPWFQLDGAVSVNEWSVRMSQDIDAPSRQNYLLVMGGVAASALPMSASRDQARNRHSNAARPPLPHRVPAACPPRARHKRLTATRSTAGGVRGMDGGGAGRLVARPGPSRRSHERP